MTSRDLQRCCDAVRSAILATAWLLVLVLTVEAFSSFMHRLQKRYRKTVQFITPNSTSAVFEGSAVLMNFCVNVYLVYGDAKIVIWPVGSGSTLALRCVACVDFRHWRCVHTQVICLRSLRTFRCVRCVIKETAISSLNSLGTIPLDINKSRGRGHLQYSKSIF